MADRPVVTDLLARGYALLPTPQRAELDGSLVSLADGVQVAVGSGVSADDTAVADLTAQLAHLTGLPAAAGGLKVTLSIADKTVATDLDEAIRSQGYRLTMSAKGVEVVGNAPAGLFYGVQTLVQLLNYKPGVGWTLPGGVVEDWPALELRMIHYDTKHHQETLAGVKSIIERAARFKINGILWEIEDKFAYQKHPLIGAPGAFTADEMRELTAFALARHVEIIPILQMPSHNAFIAKHEKYAHLREHAENNYMLDPTDPKVIQLYTELLSELADATPGCRYLHLGTDEPYFLGEGKSKPHVAGRDKGRIFADFVSTMVPVVRGFGREAMCWAEHPMTAEHMKYLPAGLINTVMREEERSRECRKAGIKEVIYTPTQGTRLFFPDYWRSQSGQGVKEGRLWTTTNEIRSRARREEGNVIATLVAAWDDSGLNAETFWLGWTTGNAVGWNQQGADVDEMVAAFMRQFYGPSAVGMTDAYRLLHDVTDFWIDSWNRAPSRRGPSFMRRYHPRRDLTLPLPNVPDPETLDNRPFWREQHAGLLTKADAAEVQFARLTGLLTENMLRAEHNRHNLEVLLSIALLLGHHVELLHTLAAIEDALSAARKAWDIVRPNDAIGNLRAAAGMARKCIAAREERYVALKATWEKNRKEKGMSEGGRDFVDIKDTTKNHTGEHTADLSYVVEAERGLNMEGWVERLEKVIDQFANGWGAIDPEPDFMMD